ncbi:uncharacterized protein EV420DRAFT_1652633 [Desarmillaria tabescens]|uniref:Uncharacterized protein n=1 Tax=Armillaria tabescens TaxID=1929756 RepID=A0AA39J4V5_ARMTA|nr:uncharacterized protein EV420DRAFT_1652633 [Desarmillaria tabescens]KAK0436191.1 hypothetical protein EV420DRAFT_1652633 [Desarmillaria tabescens]
MEWPGHDNDMLCKEQTHKLNSIASFKRRKPDVTEEELQARYPVIPEVPRKKSKREITACQKREGESNDAFSRCLRATENKWKRDVQQSEVESEAPAAGPSKRQKRTEEASWNIPSNPDLPPHIRVWSPSIKTINNLSASCSAGPCPVVDIPAPSSTDKGIQCDLRMPPRHVTDFGVSASGVSNDMPTISWHQIRMPGNSSIPPAHIVLLYIPEGSENLLQHMSPLASCHLILEDTNEHIIFIHPPFPDDMQLINTILKHLAHNRGVKLEGFRKPDIVEALTSEYMAKHWNVQPAQLVEVHDTLQSMKKPADPFKKMLHSEFIEGVTDPTCSEKILDGPMSHRGAPPPFGLMDDSYGAWNNISSQYNWPHGLSREQ